MVDARVGVPFHRVIMGATTIKVREADMSTPTQKQGTHNNNFFHLFFSFCRADQFETFVGEGKIFTPYDGCNNRIVCFRLFMAQLFYLGYYSKGLSEPVFSSDSNKITYLYFHSLVG